MLRCRLFLFADICGEEIVNYFQEYKKQTPLQFINLNRILCPPPENFWLIPLPPEDLITHPTGSLQLLLLS